MKLLFVTLAIILIAFLAMSADAVLAGGWTRQEPNNEEYRQLWSDTVQPLFLSQLNDPNVDKINTRPFVVGISTQVVAGLNINYIIKYNHQTYDVKVYRDLEQNVSISSVNRV